MGCYFEQLEMNRLTKRDIDELGLQHDKLSLHEEDGFLLFVIATCLFRLGKAQDSQKYFDVGFEKVSGVNSEGIFFLTSVVSSAIQKRPPTIFFPLHVFVNIIKILMKQNNTLRLQVKLHVWLLVMLNLVYVCPFIKSTPPTH